MTGPARPPPLPRALAWRQAAARAALLWERLWPALWPAATLAGVFIASAWTGLWRLLDPWPHAILLALFAAGFLALLAWGFQGFRWPHRHEARRRLEIASGLSHRPLATLSDRPTAGADAAGQALWQRHLARQKAALKHLRIGWPRPGVAARDPFALRALAVLLLIVGLAMAGGERGQRLLQAFDPGLRALSRPVTIDAWIDPPAYTGLAPILLAGAGGTEGAAQRAPGPIAVPVLSRLRIEVHGGGMPRLSLSGQRHPFEKGHGLEWGHQFEKIGPSDYRLAAAIPRDTGAAEEKSRTRKLVLRQGARRLAVWNLRLVPDLPPTIAFTAPPDETLHHALRLRYRAGDDYGVTRAWVEIRRAGPAKAATEKPLRLPLPLDRSRPRDFRGTSYLDLTANAWAGLKVVLTLVAEDAIGQQGRSPSVTMRLPEQPFHQPVARALIEQRRLLAADPAVSRPRVALALSAIALLHHAYRDDPGIFLGLRVATGMLRQNPDPAIVPQVEDLLWDSALTLENGSLDLAMRSLRQAEDALRQALDAGAPQSVIEKRLQALRQALDRYLAQLAKAGRMGHPVPFPPGARALSRNDLEHLLDRTGQMARSGANEAARALLDRLQSMLENLRPGTMTSGPGGAMAQALNNLLQRQQKLLDHTFGLAGRSGQNGGLAGRNGRNGDEKGFEPGPGAGTGEPGGDAGRLAQDQSDLQGALGRLLRGLGQSGIAVPNTLQGAGQAMGRAAEALRQGAPQSAVQPQMDALQQLREGAMALQRQLGAKGPNGGREPGSANEDPLGRPADGFDTGDEVHIPEHGELQQSRRILDELYRRAGDPDRPAAEIDYIHRLLDRF